MRRLLLHPIAVLLLLLLLSAGCARVEPEPPEEPLPQEPEPIHSLVVLPTVFLEQDVLGANRYRLKKGAEVMDNLLAEYFQGMDAVSLITEERKEALANFGNLLETMLLIGKRLDADAVLQVIMERYFERQGTKYSVESPASVAFRYRLVRVSTGETICQGRFDETQQPLSENLFDFPKVKRRGLKWLTAPELAKEGLRKLEECEQLRRLRESES